MTVDMSQFFQAFFEETEELLAEMEKLLLAIDVAMPDPEELNAVFRTAHSIKGGASTFGITNLAEVTHVLESLLDRIRKGEMQLTSEHVDAFLAAKDVLKMQLDGHRKGSEVDLDRVADVRMTLHSLAQSGGAAVKSASPATAPAAPAKTTRTYRLALPALAESDMNALLAELGMLGKLEQLQGGKRNLFLLETGEGSEQIIEICSFLMEPDDLRINEVELGHNAMPAPESVNDQDLGYGFFDPLSDAEKEKIRGYGLFDPLSDAEKEKIQCYGFFTPVQGQASAQAGLAGAASGAAGGHDPAHHDHHAESVHPDKKAAQKREADKSHANHESSASIRVGIEKVDQLINLVGELVITQAMIEQRTGSLDPMLHERLLNSVSQLTRNTRDLQEAVMSIRMMPMDYVFSRFPRMVRDLAAKLGKKVEFVTHGAATELDKGLIERIVDPLTHLVRNSIDHGIESPEVRLAAGKNEMGRLALSASHQGGNIIIEVTDDGGGLNRERILAKAVQQGLPASDMMQDSEVWQLIFMPGFSTAEVVTDVSGRVVGMDVVKRNIESMGGAVDIRSSRGFGTTISISLPLTLAILDGMLIRVGPEIYVLPLAYVMESMQPKSVDVKEISGKGRVIRVRGEYLPLIPLYQMFAIEPTHTDPSEGIIVILESDGRKAALFVDELVGQQQVVVKNLESNYRKVVGISGATILGDGGVSLIVDVAALLRSSRQLNDESIYS